MKTQENKKKLINLIAKVIEDIIYICILIPLIIISLQIVWQLYNKPDEIPNIFGYKIFMIFDENMDKSVKYGDLVFTKNTNPNNLKLNDIIAYRNNMNTIAIHRILDINEQIKNNKETNSEEKTRTFTMETNDSKFVNAQKVEGVLVYRIPRLGTVIYIIQHPLVIVAIESIILIIGIIWIYIAQELDKRDRRKLEIEQTQNEVDTQKKDKQQEKTKQTV